MPRECHLPRHQLRVQPGPQGRRHHLPGCADSPRGPRAPRPRAAPRSCNAPVAAVAGDVTRMCPGVRPAVRVPRRQHLRQLLPGLHCQRDDLPAYAAARRARRRLERAPRTYRDGARPHVTTAPLAAYPVKIATVRSSAPNATCTGVAKYAASPAEMTALGGCDACQSGPVTNRTMCGKSKGDTTTCCYNSKYQWDATTTTVRSYPYFSIPVVVRSLRATRLRSDRDRLCSRAAARDRSTPHGRCGRAPPTGPRCA